MCHTGWIVPRNVDRLIANGVEINAQAQDLEADREAHESLARIVRRFGVRSLLLAMSEGAACMVDLAQDGDTGVVLKEAEDRALRSLARLLRHGWRVRLAHFGRDGANAYALVLEAEPADLAQSPKIPA